MLVGDVILSAREAVPDLPGVLNPPGSEIAITASGGAVGPFFAMATYLNPWGETAPGPETASLYVAPGGSLVVTVNGLYLPFVTAINVYVGTSSNAEVWQYNLTGPFTAGQTFNLPVTSTAPPALATPPQGNSAFLPDSGGSVASASQVYRWLTDALLRLSSLNGGVPDMGGFGTQQGKANYLMPGDWQTLSDAWYDGYPLFCGSSSLAYRHNVVSSLSGMLSYTQVADTLIVELFAQPQRTAGSGSLSVAMAANSPTAQTAGFSGWVLPIGLAQIGAGSSGGGNFPYEVVAYTMSGNNLGSLVRGLGGTNGQAWPVGTPVYELNCMFKGLRAPQLYTPGMAANTIRLPSSWVPLMHKYVLSRYRQIEQQQQESDSLAKEFEAGAKEATKKKPAVGDRQIQPEETVAVDVYPLLSRVFGGGIIP